MADYFKHWLKIGKELKNAPKIFHVNWFKTDEDGKFIWPGFGDNLRVLEWIVSRSKEEIDAETTPIGYIPKKGDIDLTGLEVSDAEMDELFAIKNEDWLQEIEGIKEFYAKFGDRFPEELKKELEKLKDRLK